MNSDDVTELGNMLRSVFPEVDVVVGQLRLNYIQFDTGGVTYNFTRLETKWQVSITSPFAQVNVMDSDLTLAFSQALGVYAEQLGKEIEHLMELNTKLLGVGQC